MCPHWELNPQPSGARDYAEPQKNKFLYCVGGYTNSVFPILDPYQNQNLESALKFRYKVPQNRKSDGIQSASLSFKNNSGILTQIILLLGTSELTHFSFPF